MLLVHEASVTNTVARADFATLTRVATFRYEAQLTEPQVSAVLLGFYDAFPAKTNVGGTIDVNGNGNAAPGGVHGPMCPPITGQEAKFELINDSCGVAANHWAVVDTA